MKEKVTEATNDTLESEKYSLKFFLDQFHQMN